MRAFYKNILRTILMVLIIGSLFYVFFTVFKSKIESKQEQKMITETTDHILKYQRECDRMECNSTIYLKVENADGEVNLVSDEGFKEQTICDNKNNLLERKNNQRTEIFEFKPDNLVSVYSKGVPIISEKNSYSLQKVPSDQWVQYTCENIYCQQSKEGKDSGYSYGFLADVSRIKQIDDCGKEEIDGNVYHKYSFEIVNTLYGNKGQKEELGFRKLLNRKGFDYMRLKKGYKDVYKLLKSKYDKNTEVITVWVDEQGAIRQIEKDYTVEYYAKIMKENSEVIKSKVGQYQYPEIVSKQIYTYNPDCARIQIP